MVLQLINIINHSSTSYFGVDARRIVSSSQLSPPPFGEVQLKNLDWNSQRKHTARVFNFDTCSTSVYLKINLFTRRVAIVENLRQNPHHGGPRNGRVTVQLLGQQARISHGSYVELRMDQQEVNPRPFECSRYFVGKPMRIMVEVTLKKGFVYGEDDGAVVKIMHKSTGTILQKSIWSKPNAGLGTKGELKEDRTRIFEIMDSTVFHGDLKINGVLSLIPLTRDELTPRDSVMPHDLTNMSNLASIQVEVYKYRKVPEPISIPVVEYEAQKYQYDEKMKALDTVVRDFDALECPTIDGRYYSENGILFKLSLTGGRTIQTPPANQISRCLPPPSEIEKYICGQKQVFNFLWRSKEFLKKNKIGAVPHSHQLWEAMENNKMGRPARNIAYESLRRFDIAKFKEQWESTPIDQRSEPFNELYSTLTEFKSSFPIWWKSQQHLNLSEVKDAFEILQVRQQYWDCGQSPPVDGSLNVREGLMHLNLPENLQPAAAEDIQGSRFDNPFVIPDDVDNHPAQANSDVHSASPSQAKPASIKNEHTSDDIRLSAEDERPRKRVKTENGILSEPAEDDDEFAILEATERAQELELDDANKIIEAKRELAKSLESAAETRKALHETKSAKLRAKKN